jgi:hypothetical protein
MLRMAECFEKEGITHCVVGFMASMMYGKPHFNNAVDMVADIPLETPEAFLGNIQES